MLFLFKGFTSEWKYLDLFGTIQNTPVTEEIHFRLRRTITDQQADFLLPSLLLRTVITFTHYRILCFSLNYSIIHRQIQIRFRHTREAP